MRPETLTPSKGYHIVDEPSLKHVIEYGGINAFKIELIILVLLIITITGLIVNRKREKIVKIMVVISLILFALLSILLIGKILILKK